MKLEEETGGFMERLPDISLFLSPALINCHLPPHWTHVRLSRGRCHVDRYNGSRHLAVLLLQQPVNVIDDEAPRGCGRTASAAASRHWLIEWERKTQRGDAAWHRRGDKSIITAATACKLFTSNYAQQLRTALVSPSRIALLPGSQGHREEEFIEKQFMSVWLMQESYLGLWLMRIE